MKREKKDRLISRVPGVRRPPPHHLAQRPPLSGAARGGTPALWPQQKQKLEAVFKAKTRDEWCEIMEGSDVFFAPVLGLGEAPDHPHNVARGSFVEVGGVKQHAPTPRFSRTPSATPQAMQTPGTHTRETLLRFGFNDAEVDALIEQGAVAQL